MHSLDKICGKLKNRVQNSDPTDMNKKGLKLKKAGECTCIIR